MIEIFALVYLSKKIGVLAEQKGRKPGSWKLYTILGWVGGEIVGILLGAVLFGEGSLGPKLLIGYVFAISSYFIIRFRLRQLPDAITDDWVQHIGEPEKY